MGFDIYGLKQLENEDNYFRNNCWWWRPLWALRFDVSQYSGWEKGINNEE